ncbi:hypothetical protein [Neisseria zalophi]|uniref:hypothetical protein n=1 Tax=Neisseria zalophi TaxID=640030 RepID=UPI001CD9385B|nr:hypothetical protein [Neisseria zalophi]
MNTVTERVVGVGDGGGLAVVDGGFANKLAEGVLAEFDTAVGISGFDGQAAEVVVFETGAGIAFVFAAAFAFDARRLVFSISWPRISRLKWWIYQKTSGRSFWPSEKIRLSKRVEFFRRP